MDYKQVTIIVASGVDELVNLSFVGQRLHIDARKRDMRYICQVLGFNPDSSRSYIGLGDINNPPITMVYHSAHDLLFDVVIHADVSTSLQRQFQMTISSHACDHDFTFIGGISMLVQGNQGDDMYISKLNTELTIWMKINNIGKILS